MALLVLNDLHIGAERSAGTTGSSKLALRQHLLAEFKRLLPAAADLMLLGDLFDAHNCPPADMVEVYEALADWLETSQRKLYLVAGNHDLSKTSNVVSSFDVLGRLLTRLFPATVSVIKVPTITPYGYVIPHLANQGLFDEAVAATPECANLFLHCNYDSFFAVQSDQSLNLSKAQADAAPVTNIIIAHEHQHKRDGKVLIPGNQIASSVSDWLGSTTKYAVRVTDTVELIAIADSFTQYREQLWTSPEVTNHKFVRVVGSATAEQAAQVVSAIAKFRAISPAFVVSNAVQIESNAALGAFSTNLESVQAFDVWDALGEVLSEVEMGTLKGLT